MYADSSAAHRQSLLDILPTLQQSTSLWLCFGDWNCMQMFSKKIGGVPLTYSQTRPLKNAIYGSNLLPTSVSCAFYTWNNSSKTSERTYCKLDKAYQIISSLIKWPNPNTIIPPLSLSDHPSHQGLGQGHYEKAFLLFIL